MNIKRFIFAAIGGFVAVFAFEMLWHGFLMKGMYDATISVWRPEAESNMTFMFASQFLFAAAMAFAYTKIGKHIPCKRGIAFGLFVGLILAAPQLGTYCYLPIPLTISLMWMFAALIKSVVGGMAIAAIYTEA